MKTDDLVAALAADNRPLGRPLSLSLLIVTLAGSVFSLIGFATVLGTRPDLAEALATWRFDLKLTVVALAATLATVECIRLTRPTARPSALPAVIAGVVIAAAAALELAVSPSDTWAPKMAGQYALVCLMAIPLLALAPLAALLYAMRFGAPVSPVGAGAMAGLSSAAIAATLYATHCTDDSPLFVGTWYTIAALLVVGLGALCGRRILRW